MFEAGLYYVGDLCYCLREEWSEVCDLTISGKGMLDGEFTLADGRKFAIYETAYGDGTYFDQSGREYWVDSGSIGCVKVDDNQQQISGGNLIKFDNSFSTSAEVGGVITFGKISIDTSPEEDEDNDNEEEYEDEYEDDNLRESLNENAIIALHNRIKLI